MWLLPLALPVGMGAALIAGGHWSNAMRGRVRWWGLLAIALVVGVTVALSPDPPGGDVLLPFSLLLFLAVALRNLHWPGAGVVAVGIVANLVPVLANGYMPVRAEAIVQADLAGPLTYGDVDLGTGRRLADDASRLTALGPIVPVPLVREVFSFGDLIVMAGLVDVGFRAFKPRSARSRGPAPRHAAGRRLRTPAGEHRSSEIGGPGQPVLVGADRVLT